LNEGAAALPSSPAYRIWWLALAVSLFVLAPATAAAQDAGGYGDYVDWRGWARVAPQERPGLASSYDRAGGMIDYNHYEFPPGMIYGNLNVTAATIRGPGIIYRFWMPHRIAASPFAIRMYFDGEATPRIDTNSDQILRGVFSYFTAPLVTTFAGGQVCYEPIAFRDSLRIDTENRSGIQHYYQYTYRTFPPGTGVVSWSGTLDSKAAAARHAANDMFVHVGQHPAGESVTAVRSVVGPTSVPAGGTLTLAQLVGPGLIRRLNVRMDDATDAQLDSLRLRVFWDADALPSIDTPVGWFFGAGDNRAPYRSLPMGTDSPDGFYCYWPMPFRSAARVVLVNPMSASVPIDSTVVEYDPGPVETNMGYMHAVARQATRIAGTTRYAMAEAQGMGHYVGNLLFLEQDHDDDWMLEGDDIVIVDRADTLNGTGLEDAYNGGYYYNWVANPMPEPEGQAPPFAFRPLNGILRRAKTASPPFARADQYRWMIADRVSFTQSLEVSIENSYSEFGSRWKSVVFWYQLPVDVNGVPSPAEPAPRARGLELRSVVPNPAVDAITIRFVLPVDGPVSLDLLDVAGRKVATLGSAPRSAGVHEIRWNREHQPDGVYMVRLRAGGLTAFQKLVLIR
jgi:hypothetical protein